MGSAGRNRAALLKNNLPGGKDFCPMVFRTDAPTNFIGLDLPKRAQDIVGAFPRDLLARTAHFYCSKIRGRATRSRASARRRTASSAGAARLVRPDAGRSTAKSCCAYKESFWATPASRNSGSGRKADLSASTSAKPVCRFPTICPLSLAA